MKTIFRDFLKKLSHGNLSGLFSITYRTMIWFVYHYLCIKWFLPGKKKPDHEEIQLVEENVTFIFKSFERQGMAKRLYNNIQSYYPGVKVIIADDSAKPLDLKSDNLEVVQLPFNSGLSYGLNRALEKVETPFVIRMDDDELLTPFTRWGDQLKFLLNHPEIDLVGILPFNIPFMESLDKTARVYYGQPMFGAPKPLKIPHMTPIDDNHVVVGKSPNIFIVRTDKLKEVGYDDHIRMIDHNDFFYRAAGNIVSVLDPTAFVLHYHDRFDEHYRKFRSDVMGDRIYIANRERFR